MQKINIKFLSDKVIYVVGEKMEGDGIELRIHVKIQRKGDKMYKLTYISVPSPIARMLDLENKVAVLDPKTNCIVFKEKPQSG